MTEPYLPQSGPGAGRPQVGPEQTVGDALRNGAERLALVPDLAANAKRDAQQLLEIATGLSRVQMLASPDRTLSVEQGRRFRDLLGRRMEAIPVQYLRGSQEFYGRDFAVTRDVLIPRPETEDLVDAVLEFAGSRKRALRLADVGTGSGILAITLALELEEATVQAMDISPAALRVAAGNCARLAGSAPHGRTLEDRVRFVESDLLAAAPPEQVFDCIVSNPPYIPLHESDSLERQVRDHEPHLALFGGEDGHDIFRRLIPQAWQHLPPGGLLLMETAGRTDLLDDLLRGWEKVHYRRDLQGIERMVSAQRPENGGDGEFLNRCARSCAKS